MAGQGRSSWPSAPSMRCKRAHKAARRAVQVCRIDPDSGFGLRDARDGRAWKDRVTVIGSQCQVCVARQLAKLRQKVFRRAEWTRIC